MEKKEGGGVAPYASSACDSHKPNTCIYESEQLKCFYYGNRNIDFNKFYIQTLTFKIFVCFVLFIAQFHHISGDQEAYSLPGRRTFSSTKI
jgi:hypothetical protein